MRVGAAALYEEIDTQVAIAACTLATTEHPAEARFKYHHGRVEDRAADVAKSAGDTKNAESLFAAAVTDFQAAMSLDYPAALENTAILFENGDGVPKDLNKAGEFGLQHFNRVVASCVTPVAHQFIAHAPTSDAPQVRRVVRELLLCAAALGDVRTDAYLKERHRQGILMPLPRARLLLKPILPLCHGS